jgi:hypothetical protein
VIETRAIKPGRNDRPAFTFVRLALDRCPLQRKITRVEPTTDQQFAIVEKRRLDTEFAVRSMHPSLAGPSLMILRERPDEDSGIRPTYRHGSMRGPFVLVVQVTVDHPSSGRVLTRS